MEWYACESWTIHKEPQHSYLVAWCVPWVARNNELSQRNKDLEALPVGMFIILLAGHCQLLFVQKVVSCMRNTSQLPGYWTFSNKSSFLHLSETSWSTNSFPFATLVGSVFLGKAKTFLCQVGCKLFAGAQYDSLVLDSTGVSGSLISISYTFKLIKFGDDKPWPWPLQNDCFFFLNISRNI